MTSIRPNVSGREQNIERGTPSVKRSEPRQSKSTLCNTYYEAFSKFVCPVLHTTKKRLPGSSDPENHLASAASLLPF